MKAIHRSEIPSTGTALGGGFYTGEILLRGNPFALIKAPKSAEFHSAWGKYGEKINGAGHFVDGLANTEEMAAANLEIAIRVRDMRIGGHGDWAIPARNQQELQYRTFKPTTQENWCGYLDGYNPDSVPAGELYLPDNPLQTASDLFRKGGTEAFAEALYWSSTQSSASHAFCQYFRNGNQDITSKDNEFLVRPVRMIQIIN